MKLKHNLKSQPAIYIKCKSYMTQIVMNGLNFMLVQNESLTKALGEFIPIDIQ